MKKSELRRRLAALLLDPMPPQVRRAILFDPQTKKTLGIEPNLSFPLDHDIAVEAKSFHRALRAASAGRKSAKLSMADGKTVTAKLRRAKNGVATFEIGAKGFSFTDADLLSSNKKTRCDALKNALRAKPILESEEQFWERTAQKSNFSDEQFLEFSTTIAETPESLTDRLRNPQELSLERLVPRQEAYYHRLLCPPGSAGDIHELIAGDLLKHRSYLLRKSRRNALRRMAFTGIWQPLIPFNLLASVTAKEASELLQANDPFSLLFGFELCLAQMSKGKSNIDLGTEFLRKLFSNPQEIERRCNIFSACAIVASVALRRAIGDSRPLFWMRTAALTHAVVLADALSALPKPEGFFKWAVQNSGPDFAWHTLIDRREAPRWRADWVSPEQIEAELVGRAIGALGTVPKSKRPKPWVRQIDAAMTRLEKIGNPITAFFAGPLDDWSLSTAVVSNPVLDAVEAELASASRLSNVKGFTALAYARPASRATADHVQRILDAQAKERVQESGEQSLLPVCAHIAATARSKDLAQTVANHAARIAQTSTTVQQLGNLFTTMIEAGAAIENRDAHRAFVGECAIRMIYSAIDPRWASAFLTIADVLVQRDPKLAATFGRARAVAEAAAREPEAKAM